MDGKLERIFTILFLRFAFPMDCVLIKENFEDETFIDSKLKSQQNF